MLPIFWGSPESHLFLWIYPQTCCKGIIITDLKHLSLTHTHHRCYCEVCHTLVNKMERHNHFGKTGSLLTSIRVCALRVVKVWPHCTFLPAVYLFTVSFSSHLGFRSCSSLNCRRMGLMERPMDRLRHKYVRGRVLHFLFHLEVSSQMRIWFFSVI